MEELLIILIAIKQAIKQYHWNATTYQEHLLGDRLLEGIEDYIDEVAEISKVDQENPNLGAKHLLAEASKYLADTDYNNLKNLAWLFYSLLQEINTLDEKTMVVGIKDIYSRLSNTALRKLYLINTQVGK